MARTDKLLQKLDNDTISAKETRTLLKRLGWTLDRTRGSHEYWIKRNELITIATHTKEIKKYQIKQIKDKIGEENETHKED